MIQVTIIQMKSQRMTNEINSVIFQAIFWDKISCSDFVKIKPFMRFWVIIFVVLYINEELSSSSFFQKGPSMEISKLQHLWQALVDLALLVHKATIYCLEIKITWGRILMDYHLESDFSNSTNNNLVKTQRVRISYNNLLLKHVFVSIHDFVKKHKKLFIGPVKFYQIILWSPNYLSAYQGS